MIARKVRDNTAGCSGNKIGSGDLDVCIGSAGKSKATKAGSDNAKRSGRGGGEDAEGERRRRTTHFHRPDGRREQKSDGRVGRFSQAPAGSGLSRMAGPARGRTLAELADVAIDAALDVAVNHNDLPRRPHSLISANIFRRRFLRKLSRILRSASRPGIRGPPLLRTARVFLPLQSSISIWT